MPPRKPPPPPPSGPLYRDGALDNWRTFIDRVTGIFGGGDTGKTTLLYHLIVLVSAVIPEVTVFTKSPDSYTFIPNAYIYKGISKKKGIPALQELWDRQVEKKKIFVRANNIKTLRKLHSMCAKKRLKGTVDAARQLKELVRLRKHGPGGGAAEAYATMCDELETEIYKVVIRSHMRWLGDCKLSDDGLFALNNVNFNHRHLVIFDDVSLDLKKIQKETLFGDWIFASRHHGITTYITAHDDKILDSEYKKNIHNVAFTSAPVLAAFFRRECMDFSAALQAQAAAIAARPESFKGNQKILYVKKWKDSPFLGFTVPKRTVKDIQIGSDEWRAFGERVDALVATHSSTKYATEFA